VFNTLDEWPILYTPYHQVPLLQDQMVSVTPMSLGEFAMVKGECSTMSPTCTILPTAATICQSLVYADWLIVAMLSSYHGNLPYGPYSLCTKPTRPAYTVLTCSRLCSKAIGIYGCCDVIIQVFDGQASLASLCRPCPNDFLVV